MGPIIGGQFRRIDLTRLLTVYSVIESWSAISLFAFPEAIRRKTAISAGVSASSVACSAGCWPRRHICSRSGGLVRSTAANPAGSGTSQRPCDEACRRNRKSLLPCGPAIVSSV